jgi:uncharacterized protein YcfL
MKKVILGLVVVTLLAACHSTSTEVVCSDTTCIKMDSVKTVDSVKAVVVDSLKK